MDKLPKTVKELQEWVAEIIKQKKDIKALAKLETEKAYQLSIASEPKVFSGCTQFVNYPSPKRVRIKNSWVSDKRTATGDLGSKLAARILLADTCGGDCYSLPGRKDRPGDART